MGTRQEIGVVLMIAALSVPSLFGWLKSAKSSRPPITCLQPVEVVGEVSNPGLLCLDPEVQLATVNDLLGMPGHGTLAGSLLPGQQVRVSRGAGDTCLLVSRPMSGAHRVLVGLPIELNLAESEDLKVIPGIGSVLARRIVEARKQRGGFGSLDELLEVKGIGPTRMEKIRSYITLDLAEPTGVSR